ncbi:MAG TPA: hypothetical protein VER17_10450 [Tepidisphaeraceae bacterium]|nr:hypothetical protein [Tepidisphaeraceae bacterium]
MLRYVQYVGQFQGVRGRVTGLPSWARFILFVLAIPGVALLALSILAGLISILALLLLTVPAYRLLSAVTSGGSVAAPDQRIEQPFPQVPSPGRRHVDVKIIEP